MLLIAGILAATLLSLFFSSLTYSLRDFSRSRLEDRLEAMNKSRWLEATIAHRNDLIFVTAVGRLLANMFILLGVLSRLAPLTASPWVHYSLAVAVTAAVSLVFSVALPHALARYMGESIIALFIDFLHFMRWSLVPVTKIMHAIDAVVRRVAHTNGEPEAEEIEQEILSVVEEGEKEGVMDVQEREMIESVIEFRDTQAGQIMTARPDVVALDAAASLDEVKRTLEESGHSRIPVYAGTLDHIVGVLYARDLLRFIGLPPEQFEIRAAIRPALFVPETKPLRDLLQEFRDQKVHLAIVLDEYGGTAGLITIEDILEELVGEISDEHEPLEPAMLKRVSENVYEADARFYIDELNRRCALNIPEDAGYETLGGFVSMTLGRIPGTGTMFEHQGVRYTVLDAEPRKINRVRVELLPQLADVERRG